MIVYVSSEPTSEMLAHIEALADAWSMLPQKNYGFAQSLLQQWDEKQWLSPKQWYWVAKLGGNLRVPDFTKGLKDDLEEVEQLRATIEDPLTILAAQA